jgi:ribulose-5-phosphate 4-epimerase/fuculose-1-phosphate aldolase
MDDITEMDAHEADAAADPSSNERELRIDLAAAFRLIVEFGWHESVGNHLSAAVSPDGRRFLLNPRWRHFGLIRASDLMLLDALDLSTMERPDAPDPSAWTIHGSIHRSVPNARVILHCHPPYATALACLQDPSIKPIDQNTARYFDLATIDLNFSGIADDAAEGARLAGLLGNRPILLMGNHGVTVTAPTVAQAFEDLYFLERAAKTLMIAYASGQPLNILSDEIAKRTAIGWRAYEGMAFAHFEQLKTMLDRKDPSYRE